MKIKTQEKSYKEVLAIPKRKRKKPIRQSMLFRWLLKTLSEGELKKVNFEANYQGMDKLGKDEPALILMNHSSFIDLKIASKVLYPRPFNIICTSDGFVGKEWLMTHIGCIPTQKFVQDISLVRDMQYCIKNLKSSILMYPEASYSFDGTATRLPDGIGKCIKLLKVPVVMIRTHGAFARDPLYNGLRLRDVKVSADIKYLISSKEIEEKTPAELQEMVDREFSFDYFKWQQEEGIKIKEDFRAEDLNRVLYACPNCEAEGKMQGRNSKIKCEACGAVWHLTEDGFLEGENFETKFTHIPDWYSWQRENVKNEILDGTYKLDIPVDIKMLVDFKAIYSVGEGRLIHDKEGFTLTGCNGELNYQQPPYKSYSVYSDYYWYEIGDMICIGDQNVLYYCFPKETGDVVAKTRIAAEELYKMCR